MRKCLPMMRLAPAAALAGLLGGCGVMTVDVDVYKGPLANHVDIQTQQFAKMAVNAKPLLIQLRDNLEWDSKGNARRKGGDKREDAEIWYKAGWVRPEFDAETGKRKSKFADPQARRVNDILSLYEDKRIGVLDDFVDQTRPAFDRFRRARAIVRPTANQKREDAEIWKRYRKEFDGYTEKFVGLLQGHRAKPHIVGGAIA